ncbi:MAG: hypothetical protein M3014_04130 [Chloroflexota bacterium]|nr:hypothetical protein [Chloroflexota bacterium]
MSNRRKAATGRAATATNQSSLPRRGLIMLLSVLSGMALLFIVLLFFAPGVFTSFMPGSAQSQAGVYSPDGRISFVRSSETANTRDLYVVNSDGTQQQRITQDMSVQGTTSWSPDGKSILIQATMGKIDRVVRITVGPNNKATETVPLTGDQVDSVLPAWSPDGTLISYQSKEKSADYQVFVMNADGSNKHRVTAGKGYRGQAQWSPDGKTLVYVGGDTSDPATAKELYLLPAAGGAEKAITNMGKNLSHPTWSPDGKSILFMQGIGQQDQAILLVGTDGSAPKTIVESGPNSSPQFSPQGDKIVFYAVPNTGSDVFVVPVTGGQPIDLTTLSAEDYIPTWSPDGKKIVWSGKRGTQQRIVVAAADGSGQVAISSGDGYDYQPVWGRPVK